jgi:hypothetical protein
MPITGIERLFYTLSGAATPPYYTEAALVLLVTPALQTGDLAILSQIAQLTPSALLVGLLLLIWRGELVTKGTVDRIEVERQREREQSQVRLDATIEHYKARLQDRDHQLEQKDQQIATLLDAVKEGTLLVSQAAALVSNQKAA